MYVCHSLGKLSGFVFPPPVQCPTFMIFLGTQKRVADVLPGWYPGTRMNQLIAAPSVRSLRYFFIFIFFAIVDPAQHIEREPHLDRIVVARPSDQVLV